MSRMPNNGSNGNGNGRDRTGSAPSRTLERMEKGAFVNERPPALSQPIPSGTGAATLPPTTPPDKKNG